MAVSEDILYVKMLDDNFHIYLNNDTEINEIFILPMLRNRSIKMLQLLAYLLYYHEAKIDRTKLLVMLYGDDYDDMADNNLRAVVFRLRKILRKIGLSSDDLILNNRGVYSWNANAVTLHIDVEDFKKKALQALEMKDGPEKLEKLNQAISIYKQDFLKIFENEPWVIREGMIYRNLLSRCADEICRLYENKGQYEEIIHLCARLLDIFPEEKWFSYQIRSYITLKMPDMAHQTYDKAIKVLVDELSISPSDDFQNIFKKANSKDVRSLESIKEIREMLDDNDESRQAYYCSFPSFIDAYRLSGRIMKRNNIPAFLILCTITDTSGEIISNKKKLEKISEQLKDVLMTSIRSSDLFTRYNMSQYLLLLNGLTRESCSIVTNRISSNFKKVNLSSAYIVHFYVASVLDQPPLSKITEF